MNALRTLLHTLLCTAYEAYVIRPNPTLLENIEISTLEHVSHHLHEALPGSRQPLSWQKLGKACFDKPGMPGHVGIWDVLQTLTDTLHAASAASATYARVAWSSPFVICVSPLK